MYFRFLFCFTVALLFLQTKTLAQTSAEALSFDVKEAGLKVKMTWETSSESNIKQFNIYRSIDQENYFLIGEIPAKNRKHISRYEHLDHTANGGINYYKLEAVGIDDSRILLKYSKLDVEDREKAITVLPNVDNGTIKLISAEQILTMELVLTDMLDRVYPVSYVVDNTHELTIVTGPIFQGAYILTCYINRNRYTRKKTMFI